MVNYRKYYMCWWVCVSVLVDVSIESWCVCVTCSTSRGYINVAVAVGNMHSKSRLSVLEGKLTNSRVAETEMLVPNRKTFKR